MDPKKADECVLVVPEVRLQIAGKFHGFREDDPVFRETLLDERYLSYRPRGDVETDPTFKQLIPYVVLRCEGEIFHYTRGSSGTEKRLQSLRSVGIGGHISEDDRLISADPYRTGMLRELNEEVEIQSPYRERFLGYIYDDRTEVGEVHLGIVHLLDLTDPLVWPREAAIDEAGFAPLKDLLRHREEFETWSQFVFEVLERE